MDFYSRKNLWKFILLLFAVIIGAGTLFYTESFLQELRKEEVKKANLWAQAMITIQQSTNETELTLPIQIVESNSTIPVIVSDRQGNITQWKNLQPPKQNATEWLRKKREDMAAAGNVIAVENNNVFYENSTLLTQLRLYPIVLLFVISLFIIIAYFAFSGARKAEQNRVWTGLAKETAHQIGTPLSSLMGWLEMLKLKSADPSMIAEMEKDINRLDTITNRFSKIGSKPARKRANVVEATRQAVDYLRSRSPKKIAINFNTESAEYFAALNLPLYEWVIENLIRNAIDAIAKEGTIDVDISNTEKYIRVEVTDTGKGIPANKLKTVFRPGYSTKKRGWGLGLSLARRIIEDYHEGKIYVASSSPEIGTTFRISLKKAEA